MYSDKELIARCEAFTRCTYSADDARQKMLEEADKIALVKANTISGVIARAKALKSFNQILAPSSLAERELARLAVALVDDVVRILPHIEVSATTIATEARKITSA